MNDLASNTFTKGINTDINPKFQAEGTYRYALNAVLETTDGSIPGISNEIGNIACADNYPITKQVIGHVLTDNEDIILFLFDPAPSRPDHEIGIFTPSNCDYVTVAKGSCLNFSDKHPINAIFKIRNGCERVIYFTDNYNNYRFFNITNSDAVDSSTKNILNCDKLLYSRPYKLPRLNINTLSSDLSIKDANGLLEIGTYSFAIRYLDKEENATDWLLVTRSIPIADEPYNLSLAQGTVSLYDGGSNNSTSPFFVNKTNKSIKLTVNNLDLSFSFYQIAAIKRTSDEGIISGVDVLFPRPITVSTDLNFVYTGLDSQIQYQTSIDEILSEKQVLHKVGSHAAIDNRLYVANVTNNSPDYSSYQRYASKIKTEWVKTPITFPVSSKIKQADYYYGSSSFMPNEVYAFGIVYIHSDGTKSPVKTIIGRAPDTVTGYNPYISASNYSGTTADGFAWDTATSTQSSSLAARGVYNNLKNKRWQIISTATQSQANANRGLMGYYETTTTYPDITPCVPHVDGYWGKDWQHNLITSSTKIRHHKMPGSELGSTGAKVGDKIGVAFSNIEYPNSDVIGHYFVYGDRTQEKTIVSEGLLAPMHANDDQMIYSSSVLPRATGQIPTADSARTYVLITSEQLYDNNYTSGTYLKIDRVATSAIPQSVMTDTKLNVTVPQYDTTANIDTTVYLQQNITTTTKSNYKIEYASYIPQAPDGAILGITTYNPIVDKKMVNNSLNTNIYVVTLDTEIAEFSNGDLLEPSKALIGTLCADVDVFNNLFTINYIKGSSNHFSAPELSTTIYQLYGGDIFSAYFNFVELEYRQTSFKSITGVFVSVLLYDNNINTEFRHGSKTERKYNYWQPSYNVDHNEYRNYLISKYYEPADDTMAIYPESYNYNRSFSYQTPLDRFYPVPFNYEFCNDCREKFPYRVYYSEKDNSESSADNFQVIRINNYRDLEGSTGEITDIFINFDNLFATTTKTVYFLPTRPQEITTDQANVYIGIGSLLSTPPKQLKTTDFAFGGQQYWKSRTNTEYGTFYVDALSSRPILLTNELADISLSGMRNFWQENGQIDFGVQFKTLTNSSYPIMTATSQIGVGYISTYDPRYKRIIVTKKDFSILPQYTTTFTYLNQTTDTPSDYTVADNTLVFNNFHFYYKTSAGFNIVDNSPLYFENKSFTMSYSFLTQSWVSFHSYIPYYYFNSYDKFFSVNTYEPQKQLIYEHSKSTADYQRYYGTKYDHIVDIIAVMNPYETKLVSNVAYCSLTESYNNNSKGYEESNTTYDRFIAYNSNQSTGLQALKLKDSAFMLDNSTSEALVAKVDSKYRFNNIRDSIVNYNQAIWTTNWNDLSNTFPIDKVPNNSNIDTQASQFNSKRMRDYYLGLRLFFNPSDNLRITTDVINTIYANRNR